MAAKFTDLAQLLNRNPATTENNAPASRRLARILNADPLSLIVTNRRGRLGLKADEVQPVRQLGGHANER